MTAVKKSKWGIELFDQLSGGLPSNELGVVATPNFKIGRLLLGQYLLEGIKNGERVLFISFEHPNSSLSNWQSVGIDLHEAHKNSQLYFLNYNANIKLQIGLIDSYSDLIEEIKRLCDGKLPERIAIQNIDTLVNLSNIFLINLSTNKLAITSRESCTEHTTILGEFTKYNDETHRDLATAFEKTISGYYEITADADGRNQFTTKKVPWFNYVETPTTIAIDEKYCFVTPSKIRHAA